MNFSSRSLLLFISFLIISSKSADNTSPVISKKQHGINMRFLLEVGSVAQRATDPQKVVALFTPGCFSRIIPDIYTTSCYYGYSHGFYQDNDFTALHFLATSPNWSEEKQGVLLRFLLKEGIDINAHSREGKSALEIAVLSGSRETVDAFIKEGIDINARSREGRNALETAIVSGSREMVDAFIKAPDITINPARLLFFAVSSWPIFSHLVEDPRLFNETIDLSDKVQNGRTVMHALAESGPCYEHNQETKKQYEKEYYINLCTLARHFAQKSQLNNLDYDGNTALDLAQRERAREIIRDAGGQLSEELEPPLSHEAFVGAWQRDTVIANAEALTSEQKAQYKRHLLVAMGRDKEKMVRRLLLSGAYPLDEDAGKFFTTSCENIEITRSLFAVDIVPVDHRCSEHIRRSLVKLGDTRALSIALRSGLSIEFNAKSNQPDYSLYPATMLHAAVFYNAPIEFMELLLATENVDINAFDKSHKTPMNYCDSQNNENPIKERLERAGGFTNEQLRRAVKSTKPLGIIAAEVRAEKSLTSRYEAQLLSSLQNMAKHLATLGL